MMGGVRSRLAQFGTAQLRAYRGERLFGRTDVAVVRIKRSLVNGKTREKFAAVEIVLRKAGHPEPGESLVALLHEVAAFVNLPEKQAYGNVLGDIAFNARELAGGLVDPNKSVHLGVNGSESRSGLESRVWLHHVLGEHSVAARLPGGERKEEGVACGLNHIAAFFFSLGEFRHCVVL